MPPDDADIEITAKIRRIFYAENGRVIAQIDAPAFDRLTIVGDMLEPTEGQEYVFCGRLCPNPRYGGQQLKLTGYRTVLPTTNAGIHRYLTATARWVGSAIANRLITRFGRDVLTIIKTDPARVAAEIPGLTLARANQMAESLRLNERYEMALIEINQMLAGILGPATARKAVARWGADAAARIKRNPYDLMAMHGVGFVSADRVYQKLGRPPTRRRRHATACDAAAAGVTASKGHTVIGGNELRAEAARLLNGPLRERAVELSVRGGLLRDCGRDCYAPSAVAEDEECVASWFSAALSSSRSLQAFPSLDRSGLAADQMRAADLAEQAGVMIITGAPGTGKTYTVARIVQALHAAGLNLALAAPTGKAAKQMTLALGEAAGMAATTIHRLLKPEIDEDGAFHFRHNQSNPLECEVLVLDEASMIDVRLMASLLNALPTTSRLIIVGDHYQLPSIGPGAVLRDLLAVKVPAVELTQIKRNAGRIVLACHALKDGRVPARPALRLDLDAGENWRHLEADSPADIHEIVHRLLSVHLAPYDRLWDVQIISPVNEIGELSCDRLNTLARDVLNPAAPVDGKLAVRVGDKVVRCRNAEVRGVRLAGESESDEDGEEEFRETVQIVNGDVGCVEEITDKEIQVRLRWPDRRVLVKRSEHELRTAYCMTCHKMQGSECPVVILPLHRSLSRIPLWTREWLYTAFSRAKRMLITVGDLDAIRPALPRRATMLRNTRLTQLIAERMPVAETL